MPKLAATAPPTRSSVDKLWTTVSRLSEEELSKRGKLLAGRARRQLGDTRAYPSFSSEQGPGAVMTKDNYLRRFPLRDLIPHGDLTAQEMISVSSGSTGEAFFWPRSERQEIEGGEIHELIYRHLFNLTEETLIVICFSMGTWIAGSHTLEATRWARRRGVPLTIVTPGIDKLEALKVLRALGPSFKNIVVAGYPPFVKDILDELDEPKGALKSYPPIFLLLAGENFSEAWRERLLSRLAPPLSPLRSVSIYGTADAGAVAHETPLSQEIRKYVSERGISAAVFGDAHLPSLVQTYPHLRVIEAEEQMLLFTVDAGIPLHRYQIGDRGGVMQVSELLGRPEFADFDPGGVDSFEVWQKLPLIYLLGRRDLTATIYAVNIYPENVKAAIEKQELHEQLTGKFVMQTLYDQAMDQFLQIDLELSSDQEPVKLAPLATELIHDTLIELNGEYRKLHDSIKERALPRVVLHPKGSPLFEARHSKHRWVQRDAKG